MSLKVSVFESIVDGREASFNHITVEQPAFSSCERGHES